MTRKSSGQLALNFYRVQIDHLTKRVAELERERDHQAWMLGQLTEHAEIDRDQLAATQAEVARLTAEVEEERRWHIVEPLRQFQQPEPDKLVEDAAVAWLDPDWLAGAYTKATSPVTTFPIKGWVPLYTEEALEARGGCVVFDEEGE